MEFSNNETGEPPLSPYHGWLSTTYDALLVFEAACRGIIPRVARRVRPNERHHIRSGAIFVYDEQESDIMRWTDGMKWNASRRLGNFMVYQEQETYENFAGDRRTYSDEVLQAFQSNPGLERSLVGSRHDSFPFKVGGLIKKVISFAASNGVKQHIISYYSLEDIINGRVPSVSSIPDLRGLQISSFYIDNIHAFTFPPKTYTGVDGRQHYLAEHDEVEAERGPHHPVWFYPMVHTHGP